MQHEKWTNVFTTYRTGVGGTFSTCLRNGGKSPKTVEDFGGDLYPVVGHNRLIKK